MTLRFYATLAGEGGQLADPSPRHDQRLQSPETMTVRLAVGDESVINFDRRCGGTRPFTRRPGWDRVVCRSCSLVGRRTRYEPSIDHDARRA